MNDRTPPSFRRVKKRVEKECVICSDAFLVNPSSAPHYTTCSKECSVERNRRARKPRGEDHHRWLGDAVTCASLHTWVAKQIGRKRICDRCGKRGRTDFSNIDHRYRRVLSDYRELCPSCHKRYDKALRSVLAAHMV